MAKTPDNQITLPSGAIAIRQELKGRDYFQFQGMAAKAMTGGSATGLSDANQWLMVRAYELQKDGESVKLTVDMLDEMDFRDVSKLSNDMTTYFLAEDSTVSDSLPPAK